MLHLQAGKALHSKRAEIRVQFRHVPGNLYRGKIMGDLDSTTNELVRTRSTTTYRIENSGGMQSCQQLQRGASQVGTF